MITPILESERLILRPLLMDDADHIFKSWTYESKDYYLVIE